MLFTGYNVNDQHLKFEKINIYLPTSKLRIQRKYFGGRVNIVVSRDEKYF
jgi:hypothetical protein